MESTAADARQSLDEPETTPRWYYPAVGLLVAQMVVVYGLVGGLPAVVSALVVAVGSGWLVRAHTGRTAISVSRPAGARSAVVLAAFVTGMLVPVLGAVFADDLPAGWVLALAALALVSTVVLGPVHDTAHRADLRR